MLVREVQRRSKARRMPLGHSALSALQSCAAQSCAATLGLVALENWSEASARRLEVIYYMWACVWRACAQSRPSGTWAAFVSIKTYKHCLHFREGGNAKKRPAEQR